MQPQLRNTVASILETLWNADTKIDQHKLVAAMKAVMMADGVGIDVLVKWIKEDRVMTTPVFEVAMDSHGGRRQWTPSPKAALPHGLTEAEACEAGRAYLSVYDGALLGPKEKAFLLSLHQRFEEGRWLTEKQKSWLDILAAKHNKERI